MIDSLNTVLSFHPPEIVLNQIAKPFTMEKLEFLPVYHKNNFISYRSELENMKLTIRGNELRISNSWHKYYKGNNYCDYFATEIEKTFYKLMVQIGQNLQEATIKKIAYGCVLKEDPYLNFPYWIYLKSKKALPMSHNGIVYGSKITFTDYSIKGYDKAFEVRKHTKMVLDEQLFRVECEVKYMKHLYNRKEPINVFKPKDLFKKDVLFALSQDLITKHKNIIKGNQMNLGELSMHELNVLASLQNDLIREQIRRNRPETFKNYNKIYKRLVAGTNSVYYTGIQEKLEAKLTELIDG